MDPTNAANSWLTRGGSLGNISRKRSPRPTVGLNQELPLALKETDQSLWAMLMKTKQEKTEEREVSESASAQMAAPATLDELIPVVLGETGIPFPLRGWVLQ